MKVSKSGLFLFELIVVIFLFTVSAAVCISIFANSYNYSTQSRDLTTCTLKAETAAEVFKETRGDADALISALGANDDTHDIVSAETANPGSNTSIDEYILNIYYNEQWNNVDEINSVYTLTIKVNASGIEAGGYILSADINFINSEDRESIFNMTAKEFIEFDSEEAAGD